MIDRSIQCDTIAKTPLLGQTKLIRYYKWECWQSRPRTVKVTGIEQSVPS